MYDNAALVRQVTDLLRHPRAGLVTDIDGTISPIVALPDEAIVLPEARQALWGLTQYVQLVAVVTGRSVVDARRMVALDGVTYIGNHGLELLVNGQSETVPEARPWVPRVAAMLHEVSRVLELAAADGVLIEDKGATASIHYRLTADPDAMRLRLLEILAQCGLASGLRIEEGRRVINLLPPLTVTKGSAVSWLARENGLEAVVYLGDDVTDAHAFRALHDLHHTRGVQTLSIGVVGPETPPIVRELADTSVPTVSAVAALLGGVLESLRSSDTMQPRAQGVGSD